MNATMRAVGSGHDLLRAAQSGDPGAQEQLVELYAGLVWSTVRSFRLRDVDAHDAVQTTWLRLIENLDRIRDAERLPAWLITTAGRECLKILRRGRREVAGAEPAVFERADGGADPERQAIERTMLHLLWQHVSALPKPGRELLVALSTDDGSRYADVAQATGMPIGSVGPTRMRYLRKLRRRLECAGLDARAWH